MAETINAGHAKQRALVAFPGVTPGSTMTGRLLAVGGRNRAKNVARITLASGKVVTRRVDQVRIPPRSPEEPAMSRTMPTYCPHGKVTDWGDFAGDPPQLEPCPQCPSRVLTVLLRVERRPDGTYWWTIDEAGEQYAAGGPCVTADEATRTAVHHVGTSYP